MTTAIQVPAELQEQVPALVTWAKALKITTPDELLDATDRLKGIKAAAKQVEAYFKPMKAAADATKKSILDAEKQLSGPLAIAEQCVKSAAIIYQRAEEVKRQAEQARLQAEADERARREREALAKKAESMKTEAKRQEYQERAAAVSAPVVHIPRAEAPAGVQTRKVWKARVVDENAVPRQYLMVNEKMLDGIAKSMREKAEVPGVHFYTEDVIAIRS